MFTDIFHTFDIYLSVSLHKCYIFPMAFCVINNFGLSFLNNTLDVFSVSYHFQGTGRQKECMEKSKMGNIALFPHQGAGLLIASHGYYNQI